MSKLLPILFIIALLAPATTVVGDELRNLKRGEALPDLTLQTLDGQQVSRDDLAGEVVILVFVSAQQRSSEGAAVEAHMVAQELPEKDVRLVFATADAAEGPYFRRQRDKAGLHEPLLLDFEHKLYGALGLIVLPTTVVLDRQTRLAHVIASHKADYRHVLEAYIRHALGELDDQALAERLESKIFRRDLPEHRVERHRASARILRNSGLLADAQRELRTAMEIDPAHADARLDMASLMLAMDRVDDARAIVSEVRQQQPDHRRARLIHGVLLYRAEKLEEAAKVLEEALVLNPDPVQTHYYLGLIYEKQGNLERAIHHYRESLVRAVEDRPL